MKNISANLIEIFSSVQGEGKFVGTRQIFIRLTGCNLNCRYCDTNFQAGEFCKVETVPGEMIFRTIKNPVDAVQVAEVAKNFNEKISHHSVSFTGGEPLLNPDFIFETAKLLKKSGLKIFLETNATLPDAFEKISDVVDIVSADIKLPGIVGKNLFDVHREFFKLAAKKYLYIKVVLSDETPEEEFFSAVNLIAEVSPEILLILQPVTPFNGLQKISPEKILRFQSAALKILKDVRVIPQTHRMMKVL